MNKLHDKSSLNFKLLLHIYGQISVIPLSNVGDDIECCSSEGMEKKGQSPHTMAPFS